MFYVSVLELKFSQINLKVESLLDPSMGSIRSVVGIILDIPNFLFEIVHPLISDQKGVTFFENFHVKAFKNINELTRH